MGSVWIGLSRDRRNAWQGTKSSAGLSEGPRRRSGLFTRELRVYSKSKGNLPFS